MTLHRLPTAQDTPSSSEAPTSGAPSPECQQVLTNFWDYLDGNCSSELAEQIEAHLSSCLPCRHFRRFQERFFAALAEVRESSPAPGHVHERVREALAAERRPKPRR